METYAQKFKYEREGWLALNVFVVRFYDWYWNMLKSDFIPAIMWCVWDREETRQ